MVSFHNSMRRLKSLYKIKVKSKDTMHIVHNMDWISSAFFSIDEEKIVYKIANNFLSWDIKTGQTVQLTNFVDGKSNDEGGGSNMFGQFSQFGQRSSQQNGKARNAQDEWLYNQQVFLFDEYKENGRSQRPRRSFRS